jgi:hypothetical protein
VIAERNLYIPSLGFCLLVAVSLNKAVQQFDKHKQVSFATQRGRKVVEWKSSSLITFKGRLNKLK